MPRGPITSRPLIKDSDPTYSKYKLRYYHEHKAACAIHMKNYYEKNKEQIKAKRRESYALKKAALAKAEIKQMSNSSLPELHD
jgi:transposase